MRPTFEFFAENYTDAIFLYMNGDDDHSLADLFTEMNVHGVPAFFVYRDGQMVHRHEGTHKPVLRAAIQRHLREGEKR